MELKILLVRHGRSRHVHSGWVNRTEFLRWREEYEAAGVDPSDAPPAALKALAGGSGVLVASVARRALESAELLAPGREVLASPFLAELELQPPQLGRIRLPLMAWALSFAFRWITNPAGAHPWASTAEKHRARAAAEWLRQLAESHGSVIAVTHGAFRSLVAAELILRGWRANVPRGRSRHWSAWSFTRPS